MPLHLTAFEFVFVMAFFSAIPDDNTPLIVIVNERNTWRSSIKNQPVSLPILRDLQVPVGW